MQKKADTIFFWIVIALSFGGFFIFASASLGLLARASGAGFMDVLLTQAFFGLFLGLAAFFGLSFVEYSVWRKISPALLILGLIVTALVFAPVIGFEHNGARRWLNLGFTTVQPAEFLKFAFVAFYASWIAARKEKIATLRSGLMPLLGLLAVIGALVLLQPDTGTFGVIAITGLAMFFVAGAKIRHIAIALLLGAALLALLAFSKPYIQDRISTFLDPERDSFGSGYQIRQSLLAIGSGGWTGRGFGQSVQKFNYLPEPTNDAVFAVAAEEFGFLGASAIVLMFLAFAVRGYQIANRSPDLFGRMLSIGLVTLVVAQSFINIASMLALFPLTGVPLLFISHGGTALLTALAESGIILSVSRRMRK